jgi:hypothetical protein
MLVCRQKHARFNRLSHNEYFHVANVAQRQVSVKEVSTRPTNAHAFAESFEVVIK